MNKKLDNLFRNKLRDQQMAPPSAAWNKVQQQLNNKKQEKSFIYYKIASVCLLILISVITFKFLNKDGKQTVNFDKGVAIQLPKPQETNTNVLKEDSSNGDKSKAPAIVNEDQESKKPLQQLAENDLNLKEKVVLKEREKINNSTDQKENIIVEFEPEIETINELLIVENKPESVIEAKANNEFPGITITYKKGNPVSEEPEKTADLAVLDKDNITVKKLIKFAKELKVSEINLADIRDSKEDLLSVEIKKIRN